MPHDARLWPRMVAVELAHCGVDARIDLVARLGWTMRDGWWALTKDPRCWGEVLPQADAVVIALGGMDQLPAAIPTYLREGIAYVRPGSWRRRLRQTYRIAAPKVMRATGGPFRQLPQSATDSYLARIVGGIRYYRGNLPILLLGPAPFAARDYPATRSHGPAVVAAQDAARALGLHFLDVDPLIWPSLLDGTANPDGMHWSWRSHEAVGTAVGAMLAGRLAERGTPNAVGSD